jgi:histidinol-phosphate aminotransferase
MSTVQEQAAALVQALARPEIAAMKPYSSARSLAPGRGILLNANENPWPPPGDNDLDLNRYPEPQPAELGQLLANYYEVEENQILMTRGSDEAIDLLVRAFCAANGPKNNAPDSNDAIAICPPCFGMYAIAATIQGAGIRSYPLQATQGFQPDYEALATSGAKLIFLCSPNNPTGNLLNTQQTLDLAQRVSDSALVVVDEAYIEFSAHKSLSQALAEQANVVVLRTLSKAWGLAGVRLGALLAQAPVVDLLKRIIPPYPLPKPTIAAAARVLNELGQQRMKQQLAIIKREREHLLKHLAQAPVVQHIYPSAANFLLLRVHDAHSTVCAAARLGIVLRDQSQQAGLGQCIRITVGTPADNEAVLDFFTTYDPSAAEPKG